MRMRDRYTVKDIDGNTLKDLDATNRTQAYEQAEKCRQFYPHVCFKLMFVHADYDSKTETYHIHDHLIRTYQPK